MSATFWKDDFKRQVFGDTKIYVPGFTDLKGIERQKIFDFVWDACYRCANDGLRDERKIRRRVLRETRAAFSSVILVMILAGIVSFVVQRILERLFPKD